MKNEERINIRVVLHDLLSKPAKKIREEQEKLRESAEEASKAEKNLGEALDETGKKFDEHAKAVDDSNEALEDTVQVGKKARRSQKENTKSTDENTDATEKNTRKRQRANDETKRGDGIIVRVTGNLQKTGRGMLNFSNSYLTFVGMFRGLIMTDLAPAIPILVTGISTLASGAVALLGPLGKLGANLVHILPLYATMGTLMGVTTMAFMNMGDAIGALNDPTATIEEINEALSKLGPNAQKGARALASIAKEFKVISGAVQETYWGGGMTKALTTFVDQYLPILERGLINASKHMREASIYAMKLFGGGREQKAFENVIQGAGRSAGKLGVVFAELGRVFLFLTESAMPVFEDFLEYMANSLSGIADNMDSEELTKFFREAGEMAKGFWEGIKDIGGALRNTAKAAKPLTDYLSKGLGDVLDRWNKWTASDEGQKSMNDFFTSMIPNFEAIGNLIGSLWDAFKELGNSEWFAPFINDIANNVIPNLSKIIKALSDGLMPVFIDVSEAFSKFTENTDFTIVQPLIDIVGGIGRAVAFLLEKMSGLSPEAKNVLTYLGGLALIGVPVLGILGFIGRAFWTLVKPLKLVWGLLKFVFRFMGSAFSLLWNFGKAIWGVAKAVGSGLGKAFGAIGRFLSPVFGWIGKLIGKVGFGGLMRILGFFGKRLLMLAGPVGFVIGLLWAIWDGLKWLYDNVEWFRNAVDGAVNWIRTVWDGFKNWIVNVAIPAIITGILGMINWFKSIPTRVSEFLATTIANFLSFITTLKTNITTGIATFIGGIINWFLSMRNGIVSKFIEIRTKISQWVAFLKYTITSRIQEFVISVVKKFLAIRQGIKDVITKIREMWGNVVDWLKTNIVDRITGFVEKAVDAFQKIGGGVREAMNKIRDAASKPVDFVVNTVYNNGIRAMWNKIAKTFGLSELPHVSFNGSNSGGGGDARNQRGQTAFATGGVLPGYSPGKDIHHFSSPTGGNLHLSGGEAIMRPEFTNAVGGKSGVNALNRLAIKGQLNQAFAKGGITEFAGDLAGKALNGTKNVAGKAWNGAKNVGKAVWGGITNVADAIGGFVSDPLGTIKNVIKKPAEALYGQIHNSGSPFSGAMLEAPKRTITGLMDNAKNKVAGWFKPNEMEGGGGQLGSVHMGPPPAGGSWVRPSRGPITQRYGVPGVLSGLAHAGTDIAGGGKTYSAGDGTVYATGTGILGGRSGIGIGISHGGGIFTYYGHNPVGGVQVKPGQKVKAGQHIGYQGSTGNVTGTHLHFELHKGGWGRNVNPSAIGVYDTGGWLMPGQMAMNMSNHPEPILNGEQFGWLKAMATQGVQARQPQLVGAGGGGDYYAGDTYDVDVLVNGNSNMEPAELARAIRIELKKAKQEEKERK
ncbi:tape measure protein [Brevibacterium phage Cantare]|uniref:Tape measure protein n=1 Tax=Brevibacterium phage Cantare TaxID=2338395 RepID=A0A3G3LYM8_9CAUD|nr:tail length tape measure protein [Brevibacterium phage Cantare]AYQ99244.1 tape measure protein [Brevibacterium phage Cantare]